MLLYYITHRHSFSGNERAQRQALLRRIAEAARAGVDYIQLREKDLAVRKLQQLACEAVRAVRENSATTRVLINSRADVALACGADGVHLASGEIEPVEVRTVWKRANVGTPLIGVSVHTLEELSAANSSGADFAVLAPIFEKAETGAAGIGVDVLRAGCYQHSAGRLAILALGGVTVNNAEACMDAGAAGVAGIRLFQQGDIAATVQRLRAPEP